VLIKQIPNPSEQAQHVREVFEEATHVLATPPEQIDPDALRHFRDPEDRERLRNWPSRLLEMETQNTRLRGEWDLSEKPRATHAIVNVVEGARIVVDLEAAKAYPEHREHDGDYWYWIRCDELSNGCYCMLMKFLQPW